MPLTAWYRLRSSGWPPLVVSTTSNRPARPGDRRHARRHGGPVAVRQRAGEDRRSAGAASSMVTSTTGRAGTSAVAALTKSWTGFPRVASQVEPGSAIRRRAVGLDDVSSGGQPGTGPFRTAAEAGEEMGLDEPGQDAAGRPPRSVGRAGSGARRPAPTATWSRRRRAGAGGPGTVDDVRADQLDHSGRGGRAVGAGGAQQLDPVRSRPEPARARPAAGGSTVLLGIGRVMSGKTTTTRSPGATRSASGRPHSGDRSACSTAPHSSASGVEPVGSTTTASGGTSTVRPSVP